MAPPLPNSAHGDQLISAKQRDRFDSVKSAAASLSPRTSLEMKFDRLRAAAHGERHAGYREELDMSTLVWTRGRGFPLSRLESRLRCPNCGSWDAVLPITIPRESQTARAAKRWPSI